MDIQYFHKAIELSKGRTAKGYRMLAKHQFAREQYVESIENFEKSLQINGMQVGLKLNFLFYKINN